MPYKEGISISLKTCASYFGLPSNIGTMATGAGNPEKDKESRKKSYFFSGPATKRVGGG